MASPCDLVQDTLTIGDALKFGVGQNVPADPFTITDAASQAVLVHSSDALTISDAVIEMWTMQIADHLTIGDHIADHLVAVDLVSDALRIGDQTQVALIDLLSDAMSIGEQTACALAQTVSDHLTIGDGVAASLVATQLIHDALHISDRIQSGFSSLVSDALTISDAIYQKQTLVSLVSDGLTIGDSISSRASIFDVLVDALVINDAIAQQLTAISLASDHLVISDALYGGGNGAWTAHAEPFAMSRYTNFAFNSFASFNGRLLAAGPDGIYEVTGDKDAGANVNARIDHDLSDDVPDQRGEMQSDPNFKRPRYLYASYHSTGAIGLDLGYVDENDTSDGWIERSASYTMPAINASQFRSGRVPLGRGIRSQYLRPSIFNVSGANFSMNEGHLIVDSVKRKV